MAKGSRKSKKTAKTQKGSPKQDQSSFDPTKKSFLDLPYELRLKVYNHMLISKHSSADQATIDAATSGTMERVQRCQQAQIVDLVIQKYAINPGDLSTVDREPRTDSRRYPFVSDALGLLLANRLIYKEAFEVLYSSNTFFVSIYGDKRETFWCDGPQLDAKFPHTIPRAGFAHIQHLYLFVMLEAPFIDQSDIQNSAQNTFANLLEFVIAVLVAGNRLKTVRVLFTTCFQGEIGMMGEYLETYSGRPMDMKDVHNNVHRFIPSQRGSGSKHDIDRLYRYAKVLEPLKLWHHLVLESVTFRGDLPSTYMTHLSKRMLQSPSQHQPFDSAAHRCEYQGMPESIYTGLEAKAMDSGKYEDAAWFRKMANSPRYGPSLLRMMTAPPTEEELALARSMPFDPGMFG